MSHSRASKQFPKTLSGRRNLWVKRQNPLGNKQILCFVLLGRYSSKVTCNSLSYFPWSLWVCSRAILPNIVVKLGYLLFRIGIVWIRKCCKIIQFFRLSKVKMQSTFYFILINIKTVGYFKCFQNALLKLFLLVFAFWIMVSRKILNYTRVYSIMFTGQHYIPITESLKQKTIKD